MPKEISVSEMKSHLGPTLRWAKDNQDAVIIRVDGEPEAVLIPYATYQEMEMLQARLRKQTQLAALRELRAAIQSQIDLTDAQAYELAGISESVAAKLLDRDESTSAKSQ